MAWGPIKAASLIGFVRQGLHGPFHAFSMAGAPEKALWFMEFWGGVSPSVGPLGLVIFVLKSGDGPTFGMPSYMHFDFNISLRSLEILIVLLFFGVLSRLDWAKAPLLADIPTSATLTVQMPSSARTSIAEMAIRPRLHCWTLYLAYFHRSLYTIKRKLRVVLWILLVHWRPDRSGSCRAISVHI